MSCGHSQAEMTILPFYRNKPTADYYACFLIHGMLQVVRNANDGISKPGERMFLHKTTLSILQVDNTKRDRKKEDKMPSVADVLVFCGRITVNTLILLLRNVLLCVQYLSRSFPQASDLIATVFLVYLLYRILKRLLSMWIALIKSAVKFSIFFVLFVLVSAIYIRGVLVFFTKDIQFLSELFHKLVSGDFIFYGSATEQIRSILNDGNRYSGVDLLSFSGIEQQIQNMRNGLDKFLGASIEAIQNIPHEQEEPWVFGSFN